MSKVLPTLGDLVTEGDISRFSTRPAPKKLKPYVPKKGKKTKPRKK